jgi:hypothetical protein
LNSYQIDKKLNQASVSAFGTMDVFVWQSAEGQYLYSANVFRLYCIEAPHVAIQQALSNNPFQPTSGSALREVILCLNFLNFLFKPLKSDHMNETKWPSVLSKNNFAVFSQ